MDEQNLLVKLAIVETKLDALIFRLENLDANDGKVASLEKRVSGLERSKSWLLGAGFALGAIGGWVGDLVIHALK